MELEKWAQFFLIAVDSDPLQPTGCVDRYTSHETFSRTVWPCAHITLAQGVAACVWQNHSCTCLSVRCLFLFCLLLLPLAPPLSLSLSTCSLSCSSTSVSSEPARIKTTALTHNEEFAPWRYTTLSHVMARFGWHENGSPHQSASTPAARGLGNSRNARQPAKYHWTVGSLEPTQDAGAEAETSACTQNRVPSRTFDHFVTSTSIWDHLWERRMQRVTMLGVDPTDCTSRLLKEFLSPLANRIVLFWRKGCRLLDVGRLAAVHFMWHKQVCEWGLHQTLRNGRLATTGSTNQASGVGTFAAAVLLSCCCRGACLAAVWLLSCVDRYTSHVIFLIHLADVITLTSWLKLSQVRSHSIHMPSMMSDVWACVCCPFVFDSLSCFSHTSTFSLSPSSMSSPPRVKNHCTHAQWGVLPRGEKESSHSSCFILVCFEISLCATPLTNSTSWLKKKDWSKIRTLLMKSRPEFRSQLYEWLESF